MNIHMFCVLVVCIFSLLNTSLQLTLYLNVQASAQGHGSLENPYNDFYFALKQVSEQISDNDVEIIILGEKACRANSSSDQPLVFNKNVEIRSEPNRDTLLIFEEFPSMIISNKKILKISGLKIMAENEKNLMILQENQFEVRNEGVLYFEVSSLPSCFLRAGGLGGEDFLLLSDYFMSIFYPQEHQSRFKRAQNENPCSLL